LILGKLLNNLPDHQTRKVFQIYVANMFSAFKCLEISSIYNTSVTIKDSGKASEEEKVGKF